MSSAPINAASQEVVTGVGNCITVFFDRSKVGRRLSAEIFFPGFFKPESRQLYHVCMMRVIQTSIKEKKITSAEMLTTSMFAAMYFFVCNVASSFMK